MLSFLQQLDSSIFLFFNSMHADFLDPIMYGISYKWTWVPFYALAILLIKRRTNYRQAALCVAMIVVAVAVTDQVCAGLIRPLVMRPRPASPDSPLYNLVHVFNNYRSGHYGFPSCHAANSAAFAAFMVLFYRTRKALALFGLWMLLLCYSRLYLGVHYPGDLLIGAAIGTLVAFGAYAVYARLARTKAFTEPLRSPKFDFTSWLGITKK